MIRSGNPALKESTFLDLGTGAVVSRDAGAMTLNGTVNVRADGEIPVKHGDTVWLTPDPAKIHKFDANGKAM